MSEVREQHPDLPFIFVSGTIGEDTAVAAMKTGAQDYIMKGIEAANRADGGARFTVRLPVGRAAAGGSTA